MPTTIDLGGTAILVTGASRGLGRAMALALAEAGADLGLAGRDAAALGDTARAVAALGVRAEVMTADLRRPADIDAMLERMVGTFGQIDVLVNNAGISGADKSFVDCAPEDWDEVLGVNLRAPALCARAAARAMIPRRRGRIINIASIAAFQPLARLGPYAASKAAVVQLTRVMALELARHNVQVNALCPGYFATPLNDAFFATDRGQEVIRSSIPMRRLGRPEELGPMVVLLASDASSFMTGSVIVMDGGQMLA